MLQTQLTPHPGAIALVTQRQPSLYAAYTLIASWWFRQANPRDETGHYKLTRPIPHLQSRGVWYDCRAWSFSPTQYDFDQYTILYQFWRDHQFRFDILCMICRFQGVDIP